MRLHPQALADALDPLLAPLRADAGDVPAAWSLRWSEPDGGPVTPLHLLFECNRVVARGRDRDAVVRAFLRNLDALGALDGDRVLLDAAALHRDGTAVLGPPSVRGADPWTDRFLARAGLARVDAPGVVVDLSDGRVVLPGERPAGRWPGDGPATAGGPRRLAEVAGVVLSGGVEPAPVAATEVLRWAMGSVVAGDAARAGRTFLGSFAKVPARRVPDDRRVILHAMGELLA